MCVCVCASCCCCVSALDFSWSQVGQRHGGFTGIIQSACSLAQRHIWFERKVAADRRMVAERFVMATLHCLMHNLVPVPQCA